MKVKCLLESDSKLGLAKEFAKHACFVWKEWSCPNCKGPYSSSFVMATDYELLPDKTFCGECGKESTLTDVVSPAVVAHQCAERLRAAGHVIEGDKPCWCQVGETTEHTDIPPVYTFGENKKQRTLPPLPDTKQEPSKRGREFI